MTSDGSKKNICLVDGSGYIFRAFYALPAMTRSDGTPVNAVYGFVKMLMNLIVENRCSHIVVVFDAKRHNFRNEIYKPYKENRKETPPELIPQFPLIRQAVDAFNIPWIEKEGFEADDLIATYAKLAGEQGWHVRIISADKDLMQLMNEYTTLFDPMKKKELTIADVQAKFGVTPDKVIDVQALMGDSTDNVPGASGIGPKTAAELINQFGSLKNLLDHLDEIPQGKRREGLKRDKEKILISEQLVRLNTEVPVDSNLEKFASQDPNSDKMRSFLLENEFKTLLNKMPMWTDERIKTVHQNQVIETHYELIQIQAELERWIKRLQTRPYFAIDTETTSLNPLHAKLVGFSLSDSEGNACYVPLRHGGDEETETPPADLFSYQEAKKTQTTRPLQISVKKALELLRPLLEDEKILKIGHNIKYDMHIFAREFGADFQIKNIADTMLMSYILDGTTHGHGMDELAQLFLNHKTIKYTDICGSGKNQISFDQADLENATQYAAEDADITLRLYHVFKKRLTDDTLKFVYENIDLPLISILFKMEETGIMIDQSHLKTLNTFFGDELSRLTDDIYKLAGEEFNINSPAQLGMIFFEKMGLEGGKKGANGAYGTDVKVLETLASNGNELAKAVLEYRTFAKLKSTYVEALLKQADIKNRVHTSFLQTVTNTGRLSSQDPNLQNIPIRTTAGKEIRRAFIARSGYKLIAADYSQIELRLMADVANVKALKESFLRNEDIHARTASQIFNKPLSEIDSDTRRRAKAINFGIIYGISPFGLANQLGISRTEAKQYIESYFQNYPEIKTYMDKTIAFAEKNGFVLTPFGRRCFIQGMNERMSKGFASRAAINAPIQGGAADIIKMAMNKIDHMLTDQKLDCQLLLQVHDELVFEVKEDEVDQAKQLIKEAMEHVVQLSIPLIADIGVGDNWKEAH